MSASTVAEVTGSLQHSSVHMPRAGDASLADRRTLAAGVDAYYEASLLMGQASSPPLDELTAKALAIHDAGTRLFVHWTSEAATTECQAIGPATRCFCDHSYSSHAWYETATKHVRCRVEGCKCSCFSYVPGRGSTRLRCGCKHTLEEHRAAEGRPTRCQHEGCACAAFHATARCGSCGEAADDHHMVFETAAERRAAGKVVERNLGGWADEQPQLEAVCGGVTRMASLLSGVEREGLGPLPHTDRVPGEGLGGGGGGSGAFKSATAAILGNYDRRADAHVARLRALRDRSNQLPAAPAASEPTAAAARPQLPASGATGRAMGTVGTASGRPGGGSGRGGGRGGGGARSSDGGRGRGAAPARGAAARAVPPRMTMEQVRELAASAAEARAAAAAEGASDCAAAAGGSSSDASSAATSATVAPRLSGGGGGGGGGGDGGGSGGSADAGGRRPRSARGAPSARGSAKAAVAAVRRERIAEAAERRAGLGT